MLLRVKQYVAKPQTTRLGRLWDFISMRDKEIALGQTVFEEREKKTEHAREAWNLVLF